MDQINPEILETTTTSSNEPASTQLIVSLQVYENKLTKALDRSTLRNLISETFKTQIVQEFISTGEALQTQVKGKSTNDILHDYYVFAFKCAPLLKNLAVLHRDVFLELTKNSVYDLDNVLDAHKIATHTTDSHATLLTATTATIDLCIGEQKSVDQLKNKNKVVNRALNTVLSPWSSYATQFATLEKQLDFINDTHSQLLLMKEHFNSLHVVLKGIDVQFQQLLTYYQETIKTLNTKISANESGTYGIENALERASKMGNVQRSMQLNEDVRKIVEQLDLNELPVSCHGGKLQIRQLQVSKTVQKWLDYEIYPLLADLYALEENLKLKVHLRLHNLNKLLTLTADQQASDLLKILDIVNDELLETGAASTQIKNEIALKLDKELQVSAFYRSEDFLNVPIQTTIEKSQKDFISKSIRSFKSLRNSIKSWYKENTYVDNRSALQESTMCIAQRMRFTEMGHYDSLFMNRNFIGDLFYIARKEHETEFLRALQEWHASFAKAILITGSGLSGKSTFMQQTVKRLVKNQVVYLEPHSTFTIDGRKYSTTADLVTALEDIKKSSQIHRSKPVLCIDDIEMWQDYEHSILKNVRALQRFIEEESQDVFVVVSCSSIFRNHLKSRFKFDDYFAHILDMSHSSTHEIMSAVNIRHDTSHKTLVTNSGEQVSTSKIDKTVATMAASRHYNIGAVLQAWAFHTELVNEDHVKLVANDYEFISFFNDVEFAILKLVTIHKRTSERSLKRLTASAFEHTYKSSLKRLINIKILQRNLDGYLYVNPVILNDVENIIRKKLKI